MQKERIAARRARGRRGRAAPGRAAGERSALPQRVHACGGRHGAGRRRSAGSCRPTTRWPHARPHRARARRQRALAARPSGRHRRRCSARSTVCCRRRRRRSPPSCGACTAGERDVWVSLNGSFFTAKARRAALPHPAAPGHHRAPAGRSPAAAHRLSRRPHRTCRTAATSSSSCRARSPTATRDPRAALRRAVPRLRPVQADQRQPRPPRRATSSSSPIARRLQGYLRPDDLVARLGGDEFAILVAGRPRGRRARRARRAAAGDASASRSISPTRT